MTTGILVEGDQLLPVGVGVDIEEGEIHIVVSPVGLMTNGDLVGHKTNKTRMAYHHHPADHSSYCRSAQIPWHRRHCRYR